MIACISFVVSTAGTVFSACSFSADEIQGFFEWGEYQRLIDSLEPCMSVTPCKYDSAHCALYHGYLGVAYFVKGRVGEARNQFFCAFGFDPNFRLDSTYISEEINDLFNTTLSDYLEAQRIGRVKDSLAAAEQEAFETNIRALRLREQHAAKRSSSVLALTFFTMGTVFAAFATYEYYSTKGSYAEFQTAASHGDRQLYDRLRPAIRRANGIISGCCIAAAVSGTAGITFLIRSGRMR